MKPAFYCYGRFLAVLLLATGLVRADDAAAPAAPAATAAAPASTGSAWNILPPPKEGEVLTMTSRVKMLNATKTFLDRSQPDLEKRLAVLDNPFYAKAAPPPTPVAAAPTEATSTAPAQPVGPPKITDDDRLKTVSEGFRPTGMLEGNGVRVVQFAGSGGGQLQVGQSFSATLKNEGITVTVQLVDANENSCVLKLNNATLTVDYFAKNSSAAPPPSPSSTTPKTTTQGRD